MDKIMSKSPITCHVLDSMRGKPAKGVKVELVLIDKAGSKSQAVAEGATDDDGRCLTLLSADASLSSGIYKMIFHTGEYFEALNQPTFYPYVEISFILPDKPDPHYHIPLLLSPYSYTTYRGS